MTRLVSVDVENLFGHVHHTLVMDSARPTIVAGPNGTGKTHILRLIEAAMRTDVWYLMKAPFGVLRLVFDDRQLLIERASVASEPHASKLTLSIFGPGLDTRTAVVSSRELEQRKADEQDLPRWFRPVGHDRYVDMRSERLVTKAWVERSFPMSSCHGTLPDTSAGRDYLRAADRLKVVLIDTKRLDSESLTSLRRTPDVEASEGEERILGYIRDIQAEVASARDASLHRSQSADLQFADRALAAATMTVHVEELKQQYAKVLDLYEEMTRNGLAPDETPARLPEKPNPTAKRILALLLDDWNNRLAPLASINRKLNELRSILDSKLEGSGKRTVVGEKGQLEIVSMSGRRIPVARLSSGEQHLVAIFSQLLFATPPGSVVMIDEPEISMHMSWQHAFIDDVQKVASGSGLQVIVATHSTGVINGRWELVRELSLPPFVDECGSGEDDLVDGLEFEHE